MTEPTDPPDDRHELLYERLFTDDDFVARLESDPSGALSEVGYNVSEGEVRRLAAAQAESEANTPAAIPAVLVAVRVATSPASRPAVASSVEVRVVTATNTLARQADPGRDAD